MKDFLQFAILGLGAGAAYALFAQGAVLIYRGSGLVNFAHGAVGMLAAYTTFVVLVSERDWSTGPAIVVGILAATVISFLFQRLILRRLRNAAGIVRLISTLGLLAVVQAIVTIRYGAANVPVDQFLPDDVFTIGGVKVFEARIYLLGIAVLVTAGLWAFTKYTRTGLAITASAQNERAVQTLGWSPDSLAALTWALGGALAGAAAILVAPLSGLNPFTPTAVVLVAGLGAALLGGFQSFPMTLLGGLVMGLAETLSTQYKGDIEELLNQSSISGLPRGTAFLVILIVLVVRGRGLPLRSHVSERLPKLGTGEINVRALIVGFGVWMLLLWFAMSGEREVWAQATYVSATAAIMVLSVVVITGYAGQLSLAQWAFGGVGALIAAQFVRSVGWTMEISFLVGVLLTVPIGVIFALPALRTRGVNLAVLTLGLGVTIREVVLANAQYTSATLDGGTKVGKAELFGIPVDAVNYPHRWAFVCLVVLLLMALMVANLRRSRTGRRLLAVRTNERAAASLGISVFGVKLYAFGVAAGIAAAAGILTGFQQQLVTYERFDVFASINSVGHAVIGGLGYVLSAVFSAPNAIGGLGKRILDGWIGGFVLRDKVHIADWEELVGGAILLLILITNQSGVAALASEGARHNKLFRALRLVKDPQPPEPLSDVAIEPVAPAVLKVSDLTVRFGGVTAVDGVNFEVHPGEVVGLIGPNGAGKTTIIDAVTGFVNPSEGRLSFNDASIVSTSATQRARLGLRRSFQSLELFEDLSVEQNLRAGADTGASWVSWITDLFWPGKHPLPATAVTAITTFELEGHLAQLPGELPYGRRRLVGIARAVASGPSIVMLDEPAAGLDEVESRELATLIRNLAEQQKMGVLLVEHDVGLVMSTCDRIVVIDFGRVIATGTPTEVRNNPAVKAAYLGSSEHDEPADDQLEVVKA